MFSHALTILVGCMAVASSRETGRPMPTITNSLVNLGKMEVSFYFSGNGRGKILIKCDAFPKEKSITKSYKYIERLKRTLDTF